MSDRSAQSQEAEASAQGKMKGKEYLAELEKLQVELCILQEWIKSTGQRVIIVFEGATQPARAG